MNFLYLVLGCGIFYGLFKLAEYIFRDYKPQKWKKYYMSDKDYNEMVRRDAEVEDLRRKGTWK